MDVSDFRARGAPVGAFVVSTCAATGVASIICASTAPVPSGVTVDHCSAVTGTVMSHRFVPNSGSYRFRGPMMGAGCRVATRQTCTRRCARTYDQQPLCAAGSGPRMDGLFARRGDGRGLYAGARDACDRTLPAGRAQYRTCQDPPASGGRLPDSIAQQGAAQCGECISCCAWSQDRLRIPSRPGSPAMLCPQWRGASSGHPVRIACQCLSCGQRRIRARGFP